MSDQIVISNVKQFYEIASEAFDSMNLDMENNTRPKPSGESGHIITYDSQQNSFKKAFITIIFCGVCLEASLHLVNVERNGIQTAQKFDKGVYEEKLKYLGRNNQEILDLCTKYRAIRKEILHEKAHLNNGSINIAEREAEQAMLMLHQVFEFFEIKIG